MTAHGTSNAHPEKVEALDDMLFIATDGSFKSYRELVDDNRGLAGNLRAAVSARLVNEAAAIEGVAAIIEHSANSMSASVAEEVDVDRL